MFLFYTLMILIPTEIKSASLLDAVFWEVKPFIFTNENGNLDGIIPMIFEQAQSACLNANESLSIVNFGTKMPTRKEFLDLVKSNVTYGQRELKNVSKHKAFWAPVLTYKDRTKSNFEHHRGFTLFQLMKLDSVVVIVPRHLISLPNKILRGILSCRHIFLIALVLSALFGMITWVMEQRNNEEFNKTFIKGSSTGLWWSVVSMTSVGYGDIVPRSFLGRSVAVIWLFIGVMITCVMTATMADFVAGVEDLNIHGKKVSVLENSYEEKVAASDYNADVVPAGSYEEVLELVSQHKVFAGIMAENVAAWYQDEIHNDSLDTPLRIVEKLPAHVYLNCYISSSISKETKEIFKCMYYKREEIYTHSIEHFQSYCQIETLYIGSTIELFQSSIYAQILLGLVCSLFTLGTAIEMLKKKKKNKTNNNSLHMIALKE